jgi:predicted phage tail component-like protein
MIGFSYNGIHGSTYEIVARSVDRVLLPALRSKQLEIPGRHGTYDFGENTYANRIVSVSLEYVGESFTELRTRAREISAWLTGVNGAKRLIFDDEPDKYYMAKIYNQMALSNIFKQGKTEAAFECEPFAYSVTLFTDTASVTASGSTLTVSSSGTIDTPFTVILQNNGISAISTFTLTRSALIS